MDGLRSVFNERSRCFCRRYVSLLRFIDSSMLKTAGIVLEDSLTDEFLWRISGSDLFAFSDIWLDEEGFNMMSRKTGGALFRFMVGNSQTLSGHPARNRLTPRPRLSISSCADSRLQKAFQLVIIANSFICRNKNSHTSEDLWNVRSVAGSRLLQCLEKALSNSSLSNFDADTVLALIQILYLTISAVFEIPPRVQLLPVSLL